MEKVGTILNFDSGEFDEVYITPNGKVKRVPFNSGDQLTCEDGGPMKRPPLMSDLFLKTSTTDKWDADKN